MEDVWKKNDNGKNENAFEQAFGSPKIPSDGDAVRPEDQTSSGAVSGEFGSSESYPFA